MQLFSVEREPRRKRGFRKIRESLTNNNDKKTVVIEGDSDKEKEKPILMVEVENVVHEPFKTTEEVKVFFF